MAVNFLTTWLRIDYMKPWVISVVDQCYGGRGHTFIVLFLSLALSFCLFLTLISQQRTVALSSRTVICLNDVWRGRSGFRLQWWLRVPLNIASTVPWSALWTGAPGESRLTCRTELVGNLWWQALMSVRLGLYFAQWCHLERNHTTGFQGFVAGMHRMQPSFRRQIILWCLSYRRDLM